MNKYPCGLREDGTCDISQIMADKAVEKCFAIIGVDIHHPESIEEFREDLRFGRKLRKVADHSILAIVGAILTAIVAILADRLWR